MDYITRAIYTSIIIFFILLIIARMLGNKQISQLTFFNYITGITMGSIAANAINVNINTLVDEVIGLTIWFILTEIIGFISLKSLIWRPVLTGQPQIVIKKGKIQHDTMKKLRLSTSDLTAMLRNQKVFNLSDIYYAILETNGKLSILKKVGKKEVNNEDMGIYKEEVKHVTGAIVIDGNLLTNNLKELGKSEEWFLKELKKQGIDDYRDIMYAELQGDNTIYIDSDKVNKKEP